MHHVVTNCSFCHYCNVDFVLFHIVTLLLYYHASMLTPHTPLISYALWLPQSVILGRLECTLIFSNAGPPINLLLSVAKDGVLDHRSTNPPVTNTCRLWIL